MRDIKFGNREGGRPRINSSVSQSGKKNEPDYAEDAKRIFNQHLSYQPLWIEKHADSDMIVFVEEAGKLLADYGLKSSKIRGIYGEIKRIEGDTTKNLSQYYLLKPKVAYAVGRDKSVIGLQLFKVIFDKVYDDIKGNENNFKRFCEFMEAIIAYHKFYVKNDK